MRTVRDDEMEREMGGPRFLGGRLNGIYEHQGSFVCYSRLGGLKGRQKHQNSDS